MFYVRNIYIGIKPDSGIKICIILYKCPVLKEASSKLFTLGNQNVISTHYLLYLYVTYSDVVSLDNIAHL